MAGVQITRVGPADTARSFGIGHYRAAAEKGKNVSQLLEELDPTNERPEAERGLDAFERVLKEAGLITAPVPEYGIRASTWEDATRTAEKRALIPEFCARIWRQTTAPTLFRPTAATRALILSGDTASNTLLNQYADSFQPEYKKLVPPVPLNAVVARTTQIDTDAYRTLYITDDFGTDAYRMKRVAEGADIPRTSLVTGEHTLRIHKFGRALQATYEQLRRQRFDRIAFLIMRMAQQAEVDKVALVIDVLVNGDGNANTSASVLALTALDAAASAGSLTLKGWLTFKLRMALGYNLDVVLAQEASTLQLLTLPIGSSTNALPLALTENAFGAVTPINDRLAGGIRYGVTTDAPALKLVALDSSLAVERVVEIGGNVSEVERFINNQTTLLTMTEVEGFGRLDINSALILNING